MSKVSKIILLSIFLVLIARGESNALTSRDLGGCSEISLVMANPVTIEVSYTLNGSLISFSYDTGTSLEDNQQFIKAVEDFGIHLFESKQMPKEFTHAYSNDVLCIDVELQSLCEILSTLV